MKSYRTTPHACLGCGKILDAASGALPHHKPRPGSVTICIYCGHIMALKADLTVRALTDAEMIAIAGDPRVLAVQAARQRVMAKAPTT